MRRLDLHLARAAADALGPGTVDNGLRSRLASLPALIQTSGLAATCAFLLAKGEDRDRRAATALLTEAAGTLGLPDAAPEAWLDRLSQVDEHRLAVAEQRAAMLALWLSRLAAARFKADERAANGG